MRVLLAFLALMGCVEDEKPLPPPRHCALAIPPSYVVRMAELEVVYCSGGCDFYQPGWIVVTGPIPCD